MSGILLCVGLVLVFIGAAFDKYDTSAPLWVTRMVGLALAVGSLGWFYVGGEYAALRLRGDTHICEVQP